jgi:hypothetical protein
MSAHAPTYIPVRFSARVGRVLECDAPGGRIEFTVDSGPHDKSIYLEHHPHDWPRGPAYVAAFEAARKYLESCGYEVEIHGS